MMVLPQLIRVVRRPWALAFAAAWTVLAVNASAWAQLQITELMVDTVGPNDDAWEWIEVLNTNATPVDLNLYIADRLGDEQFVTASVDSALSMNTVVPAGGVAVIYDADHPLAAADFNDSLFRTAWGLSPSVPLIGARNWPALTNTGGTAIGFWPDAAAYNADLANLDADEDLEVASFANAAFSLDFRTTSGFPSAPSGVSLRWNGQGSNSDGANWGPTTSGVTSVPATLSGSVNSDQDVGNPGVFPGGTPGTGLFFTEIMYNPRSGGNNEAPWEWVEVFNNTGSTIDFGAMPYVFDDDDDAAKTEANVTSGVIPNGTGGVLFNASATGGVTLTDLQAAWDPDGTRGINFIPVSSFTALAQGGDMIALWPSLAAYQGEAITGSGRTMANAIATVAYDDQVPPWPQDDGNGSIYLTSFDVDPTVGESWALSSEGDGISFNAAPISGTITIHPGGDLGTPGTFGVVAGPDADFDNDLDVDVNDLALWKAAFATTAVGDADGDGDSDGNDFLRWQRQLGTVPAVGAATAVPEPATLALAGLAVLTISFGSHGRRRGKRAK